MVEKRSPGRRRSKRQPKSKNLSVSQLPWQQLKIACQPTGVANEEELDLIHDRSMRILEVAGIDVLLPQAREMMVAAGAQANGERVCFDGEMISNLLASAPKSFTLHARNPEHNTIVEGKRLYKQLLNEYATPILAQAQLEELEAFVQTRVSEGGVKTAFKRVEGSRSAAVQVQSGPGLIACRQSTQ